MKSVFKSFIPVILVVVMIFSVTACGTNSGTTGQAKSAEQSKAAEQSTKEEAKKAEPVTFSFALPSQWANKAAVKQLVEKYQQKTGNKIEVQALDDKSYVNLYLTKLATGDCWDIIWHKVNATDFNVEKNFADLSNEPWLKNVSESIINDFLKVNGKVYCAPFNGTFTMGIIYNKKIFEDLKLTVPKTEKEFIAACEAIKAKGITPIYLAGKDLWPLVQFLNCDWGAIEAANAGVIEKLNKNEIKWSQLPQFIEYSKKIQDYKGKGYYNKDFTTATYDMLLKNFAEGRAAMMFMGDWITGDLTTKYPDFKTYGMFARPSENGDNYITVTAPDVLYIYNKSKNVDTVKGFVAFWEESENRDIYFDENATFPVFKGQKVAKLNPCAADVLPNLDSGKIKGHWANRAVVFPADWGMNDYQLLFLGKLTPEQFAKKWDDVVAQRGKDLKVPGF